MPTSVTHTINFYFKVFTVLTLTMGFAEASMSSKVLKYNNVFGIYEEEVLA